MTRNDLANTEGTDGGVDRRLARHGGLTYLEIPAGNPARSAEFYRRVFDWKIQRRGDEDLRFEDATGHLIGRWVIGRAVAPEAGLVPYLYVDRLDEAVERVAAHGGAVVRVPYPEGNVRVALVRDPAGNVIGLWQEAARSD